MKSITYRSAMPSGAEFRLKFASLHLRAGSCYLGMTLEQMGIRFLNPHSELGLEHGPKGRTIASVFFSTT
jgi:hypothetical protein